MRSRFPGFAMVRVVCSRCGWFRILGHNGSDGAAHALIRLTADPAPCNLVRAKVIEVPAGDESELWAARLCGYRDLTADWRWDQPPAELAAALRRSRPLIQGRPCPRCRGDGGVRLDVSLDPGPDRSSWIVIMCEPVAEPGLSD